MPVSVNQIASFIAYLSLKEYAAATIRTYVSALSHMHKLLGDFNPTSHFQIKKLLDATDKSNSTGSQLKPMSTELLHQILDNLHLFVKSHYERVLYKALYLVMFHLCARVGEVALSNNNHSNILQLKDVSVLKSGDRQTVGFLITFTKFKHSKKSPEQAFKLNSTTSAHCPVKALDCYLTSRGGDSGPLFKQINGSPVPAQQVAVILHQALNHLKVDAKAYGTHSFRIGRCTEEAKKGASNAQLQALGRWHSNAYLKYIRPEYVNLEL